jgi:hypothetical protein
MKTVPAPRLGGAVAVLAVAALGLFVSNLRLGAQQSAPVQKLVAIDGILLRGTPATLKPAVARYWETEGQFQSRLTLPADAAFPTRSAFGKRQEVERSLYALFDVPNAAQLAAQFSGEVDILYEWEGMASSPLQEAKSALAFLKRHPGTPIAPFVHFFVAHRYVCADEMPFGDLKGNLKQELASGTQSELALAKQTSHPLLTFVVADFTQRPRCNDSLDTPRQSIR